MIESLQQTELDLFEQEILNLNELIRLNQPYSPQENSFYK